MIKGRDERKQGVDMKKRLEKKDILTLPNMLSMFRIILIPIIVVLYVKQHRYGATTLVILLSGITDIADGYIARRFNMISDFGKVLDPIADKLTQAAILLCLVTRFPYMFYLFLLMAIKETIMFITGAMGVYYSGEVHGADWHGKLNTVLIYFMMVMHIVWYKMPLHISKLGVLIVAGVMIFSLSQYVIRNMRLVRKHKKNA